MSRNQIYVGIDIGGTSIKLAFIFENGEILEKWEIPTNTEENGKSIPQDIANSVNTKMTSHGIMQEQLIGIGAGAPGYVDIDKGFVYEAVNIGWKNYDLKEKLKTYFDVPIIVSNDANVAALGEHWIGAGKTVKNMIAVTLGTGVGGGIIVDDRLINGASGSGGEIGHIIVTPNEGHTCNCGRQGCIETYASATGIARQAMEAIHNNEDTTLKDIFERNGEITSKDVFEEGKKGDKVSNQIIHNTMNLLGLMLGNLSTVINPEIIVIGGGVSKAKEQLLVPLQKAYNQYCLDHALKISEIKLAQLGNDAGVIGAAYLVKQLIKNM